MALLVGLNPHVVGQLGVLPDPDLLAEIVPPVVVVAEASVAVENEVGPVIALLLPDLLALHLAVFDARSIFDGLLATVRGFRRRLFVRVGRLQALPRRVGAWTHDTAETGGPVPTMYRIGVVDPGEADHTVLPVEHGVIVRGRLAPGREGLLCGLVADSDVLTLVCVVLIAIVRHAVPRLRPRRIVRTAGGVVGEEGVTGHVLRVALGGHRERVREGK